MSWQDDGITMDEYKNFVRFSTPQAASEVIYAGMVERMNLGQGSSGGYSISGSNYVAYGGYPVDRRFDHDTGNMRRTVLYDMMTKLNRVVCSYSYPNWVVPSTISGGTLRFWQDDFGELLSSAGIPEFADSNNPRSFSFPPLCPANDANAFVGIASALSLLQYSMNESTLSRHTYVERVSGFQGATPVTEYYWERFVSGTHEYLSAKNNSFGETIYWKHPISARLSNNSTYVGALFSAVFSGGVEVTSGSGTSSSANYVSLLTSNVSITIAPGGVEYFPITGYYTYGKTAEELIPEYNHYTYVEYPYGYVPWEPRMVFSRAFVSSAYSLDLVGEAAIFFGGTQTVNNQ